MEDILAQGTTTKPVSNPVPTPQSNRNWLIPLFSVLLILLLASTGYLYYQNQQFKNMLITYKPQPTPAPSTTSDPTVNWKIYTNKELSFNLKYPSDWVIDFEIENANIFNLSSANSVLHLLNYEDKSINAKEYLSKLDRIGSVGVKNTKEVMVGGLNALQRLEGPFGSGFYLWSTYFKSGDSFFQITIEPKKGSEVRTEDIDIYNQILSTFNFLDMTSSKIYTGKLFSIDTSIWKLLSAANQSPATPEVLETVAFENGQARMNIQVGTDTFEKVLASQDGEVVGNVVIDGATATKKIGYGGIAGSVYSLNLVLSRQGKTYIIGFYTQDSKNISDYEKKFNEAVSTFKFTQ